MSNRTRTIAVALCLSFALGCKGGATVNPQGPARARVELEGLDACITKIHVEVTQGTESEPKDIPLTNGAGSAEFTRPFRWTQPLGIRATVVEIKQTDECQRFRGLMLSFAGTLDAKPNDTYSVPLDRLAQYRQTDVAGPTSVTVFGGKGGVGPDEPRVILWATPGNCRRTCWEQWVNLQYFWLQAGGPPVELLRGITYHPSGQPQGRPYGAFARDLPQGSTGNCFREDPIPGVDGATGIQDRPRQPTSGVLGDGILGLQGLPNPPMPPDPRPFDARLLFTVRSVLWCEDPAPRAVIGYFRWTATQEIQFSSVMQTATVRSSKYEITDPEWTEGTAGIESPPIVIR